MPRPTERRCRSALLGCGWEYPCQADAALPAGATGSRPRRNAPTASLRRLGRIPHQLAMEEALRRVEGRELALVQQEVVHVVRSRRGSLAGTESHIKRGVKQRIAAGRCSFVPREDISNALNGVRCSDLIHRQGNVERAQQVLRECGSRDLGMQPLDRACVFLRSTCVVPIRAVHAPNGRLDVENCEEARRYLLSRSHRRIATIG